MDKLKNLFNKNQNTKLSFSDLSSHFRSIASLNKNLETLLNLEYIIQLSDDSYMLNERIASEILKLKEEIVSMLKTSARTSRQIKKFLSKNLTIFVINKYLKDLLEDKKIVKVSNNCYTSIEYEHEYINKIKVSMFYSGNVIDTEMVENFEKIFITIFKKRREKNILSLNIDEIYKIICEFKIVNAIKKSDIEEFLQCMVYDGILETFNDEFGIKKYFQIK